MVSSRSSSAPSRNPYHPPSGNWSPPVRILPPSSAADARVRSASPRPPTSACLRSAAARLAGSDFVTVRSALPGSSPAEPAPGDSDGSNPLRPPLRPSRCPAPDCRTPSEIPSATGRRSSVSSHLHRWFVISDFVSDTSASRPGARRNPRAESMSTLDCLPRLSGAKTASANRIEALASPARCGSCRRSKAPTPWSPACPV